MSTAVVRSKFRTALTSQFPTVQYVETIGTNVDTETLGALWMAMSFAANSQERLSIGSPSYWEETGVVRVVVVGESGNGDAAVTAQADAVADFFRNWQDPVETTLRVTGVQPPAELDEESDGKWILFSVDIFYSRGFFA